MAPSDHRGFDRRRHDGNLDVTPFSRRGYAARNSESDPSTRTPATSEGLDPLHLERKTARADAADTGHATARGPAAKTPKREGPDGWHPPDNAPRPARAEGDENLMRGARPGLSTTPTKVASPAGGNRESGRCREVRP